MLSDSHTRVLGNREMFWKCCLSYRWGLYQVYCPIFVSFLTRCCWLCWHSLWVWRVGGWKPKAWLCGVAFILHFICAFGLVPVLTDLQTNVKRSPLCSFLLAVLKKDRGWGHSATDCSVVICTVSGWKTHSRDPHWGLTKVWLNGLGPF